MIHAIHRSGPLDACPLDGRMHLRLQTDRDEISACFLHYVCNKNKWRTDRRRVPMERRFRDSAYDYYSCSVPLTDTRFAYVFELLTPEGRSLWLSEEGLTESYDHNLSYFNFFQYPSQFPCDQLRRRDWTGEAVAYQIFPERFAVGEAENAAKAVNRRWGEKPTPKSFFGGDLAGICRKLPYLEELGVTFLYLTPVFCSPSNHKYDTTDYERVDPAFGGNAALKELIDGAHRRGIRVMLDGVFNHLSWLHPFFRDAKERGGRSPYYDWFFFSEDGTYRTFASVPYMPKLNTANPAVIAYFSSIAVKWMRDYGVDGWRLDVSDEMSHRFLQRFREAVLAERPDAVIIGEDWHTAARYLNGDEYDGVMNYGFTKACLDLLAFDRLTPSGFRDRLIRLYHARSAAASENMLNLLGSHDTDRFLTWVGGDARRYRAAAAMMFFYPGIPCVYYGDEIGLEGGYDPDNRRCFDWNEEHWDRETRALIQRLARLKRQPALSAGRFALEEDGGLLRFIRSAPGQMLTLTVNPSAEERRGLPAFGYEISQTGGDR